MSTPYRTPMPPLVRVSAPPCPPWWRRALCWVGWFHEWELTVEWMRAVFGAVPEEFPTLETLRTIPMERCRFCRRTR